MNEQLVKEVFTRIDALAAKLGIAVETIWPWAVKQAFYEGILDAVSISVPLVVGIALYVHGEWKYDNKGSLTPRTINRIIGAALTCLFGLLGVGAFTSVTTKIFNPEYAALRKFVETFK